MTRIRVKDFGPIGAANVELKPLTVFMGPNNSGKSYLSLSIYCLSRILAAERRGVAQWPGYFTSWPRVVFPHELIARTETALNEEWLNASSVPRTTTKIGELPQSIQDILRTADRALADSLGGMFGNELQRCYGKELPQLIRSNNASFATSFEVEVSDDTAELHWSMRSHEQEIHTADWKDNQRERVIEFGTDIPPISYLRDDPGYFLDSVTRTSTLRIVRGLLPNAHYVPASRSGILLGHKTLVAMIVGQSSRAWIEPMEIPRLPGVITDLIQELLLFRPNMGRNTSSREVVEFLEQEVAKGTVDVEMRLEYPEIFYENDTGKFLLHEVSSMISEVAPIVLYLKYLVRRNQLFIIEEPESHIDSENQRKLARAIVMLVNSGVKVLLTTHSDFFVNQLNNLLLLSRVAPRRRPRRTYKRNEILNPANVGAYWFEPSDDGTLVQELNVTGEEGIPTFSFTRTHSDLYDEAIALEHLPRLN